MADAYTVRHSRRLKGAVQFFNLVGQETVGITSVYLCLLLFMLLMHLVNN